MMMTDPLKKALDAVAASLLKTAAEPATEVELKVDIFKAVASYHVASNRGTAKAKPVDDSVGTFADLRNRLRAQPQDGGTA